MADSAPRHGVVLLAAGASRRLGRAKQLIVVDGETLVHRAARLALATEPADAVAVLGAGEAAVRSALAGLPVRVHHAADWPEGMGRSLRQGLASLDAACDGALVVLCDQPALCASHLAQLVQAWRKSPRRAAASGYAGVVGVPALLPRAWFPELPYGDRGARDLLRSRPEDVQVIVDESLAHDVDLPE